MICNKCGNKSDDDSVYCSKCGAKFDYSEIQNEYQVLPKKGMQTSSKVAIIIGISFVVLFGLAYLGTPFESGETPVDPSGLKLEDQFPELLKILPVTTKSIYVDSLPFGVSSVYKNTVSDAILSWEQYVDEPFKQTSSQQNADVTVGWVKEFGGKHAGYLLGSDYIEVGIGDSFCLGKWQPYTYETVLNIAMHELGHVLDYDHTNDPSDVMYHTIITKYETDVDETAFLPDGASRFYPICSKNSVADYVFEVSSNAPANIWIVPSRNDYELFTAEQSFTHYPSCQAEKVTLYKKTCSVEQGGGIILVNPTTFGLGKDAQFQIKIKEL